MTKYIIQNLVEIRDLIKELSEEQYSRKLEILTGSSMGQHVGLINIEIQPRGKIRMQRDLFAGNRK